MKNDLKHALLSMLRCQHVSGPSYCSQLGFSEWQQGAWQGSCLGFVPAGRCNVGIWGTQPDAIDEAEDRDRWMALLERLDIKQPPGTMATTEEGALAASKKCACQNSQTSMSYLPLLCLALCCVVLQHQPLLCSHMIDFLSFRVLCHSIATVSRIQPSS